MVLMKHILFNKKNHQLFKLSHPKEQNPRSDSFSPTSFYSCLHNVVFFIAESQVLSFKISFFINKAKQPEPFAK